MLIFIAYTVMPVTSLWFFFVAFRRKYRGTSQWIRSVNLVLAIIGLIWSALGFLLLFYSNSDIETKLHSLLSNS